jgi:hypothetical protein
VTELELLRRRRELVVLSAELQRATIAKRLERIEANPARRVLGIAASYLRRPAVLKVGTALLGFGLRTWRRRRTLRRQNRIQPAL